MIETPIGFAWAAIVFGVIVMRLSWRRDGVCLLAGAIMLGGGIWGIFS